MRAETFVTAEMSRPAAQPAPAAQSAAAVLKPAAEAVQTFQINVAPNILPPNPEPQRAARAPRRTGSAAAPS